GRGQSVALTARYIGFTPQTRTVVLSGTVTADFRLVRDPLRLNQVVVTGVAEATETRKLPFAVGKVDAEVIEQVPALNPASALVGKVAGARVVTPSGLPGAETAVRLRSATSLTPGASQQPLLVVDGIITKGSLADINVLDIESIEVLKGPASAGRLGRALRLRRGGRRDPGDHQARAQRGGRAHEHHAAQRDRRGQHRASPPAQPQHELREPRHAPERADRLPA
ncbi:MAG: TonB-dependent receptor plug domain-containing protein, partial [Gemmatimonadaceae bacterium]|nr:TonB-dependent receptor plug domain-containing protein [Gemmatimonadaceae bacterium]